MSYNNDNNTANKGQTRRSMFGRLAAATAAVTGLPIIAQAQPAPAARSAPPTLPANLFCPAAPDRSKCCLFLVSIPSIVKTSF